MLRTRFRTRARFIPAVSGGGGFSITNSLRFNDDDSAYLSRTPSVAGNRKTWTWSGWVKRGNLGTTQNIFSSDTNDIQQQHRIRFRADDTIELFSFDGSNAYSAISSAVFRDASGWYHVVGIYDTSNATANDRMILYVNGSRLSLSTNTMPPLNYDGILNNTISHNIGRWFTTGYPSEYFDGYMAEVNFIDGQALTPDDFGQIDATTGEWSPKAYAGTYGTNGFYLPFDGNANDDSGNGNNWTENNLASTDYMIDTPTNNFSVLNPLTTPMSISEGNLKAATTVNNLWQSAVSTIGVSSGKWYFETSAPQDTTMIGITTNSNFGQNAGNNYLGSTADSWSYYFTATKVNNTSFTSYGATYTGGDVIGCALDMDAGTVTFYKNNVSQGVAFTGLSGTMFCGVSVNVGSGTASNNINFGADSSFAGLKTRQGNTDANGKGDFYYTPPTGYLALCTDNLPAPTIEQPETQFNVVTYTGNSADRNIDLGFEADFVWIKRREIASQNCLFDRVRGNGQFLFSNLTNAEFNGVNDGIHFDYANGFNIDVGTNVSYYNETGGSYVAWCWKAGGTAVSNTDGSITSQVSANVDAGFSVVSYTGTGANATVGHGLDSTPDMVIVKNRDSSGFSWPVYHKNLSTALHLLILNTTDAETTVGSGGFFTAAPSSSVLNIGFWGGVNANTNNYIAYCFHSVEGFSKFGSYVGNGSTNGPFVYTGFKPAFVMIKRTDASDATTAWEIIDNERSGYNVANDLLYANLTDAEYSGATFPSWDILSNGFKPRASRANFNANGGTYIYMAFAEHPFKEALAR